MLWTFITFVLMVASTGATLVATGVVDPKGLAGRTTDTLHEAAAGVRESYEELTGTNDDLRVLPGVDVEVSDGGEFTTVCHRTGDEQRTLISPRPALAAHLAHGDTEGLCTEPPGPPDGGAASITVCHTPPGNAGTARALTVSAAALAVHLAHGDTRGACPPTAPIAATPSARRSAGTTAPAFGAEGQDHGGTSGGPGQPHGPGPKTGANAAERHDPDHRGPGLGSGKEAAPTGDDDDAD